MSSAELGLFSPKQAKRLREGSTRASRGQVRVAPRGPTCCIPGFLQSCQGLLCPGRAAPRSSTRRFQLLDPGVGCPGGCCQWRWDRTAEQWWARRAGGRLAKPAVLWM